MNIGTSQHLPVSHWHDALDRGSTAKILKAVKHGQPMHPVLPINISNEGDLLSPLALVYKWDWKRKTKACMAALEALIDAGADPNLPDPQGRRPLNLALWLGQIYNIEDEAIIALLKSGADPALTSFTTPNTVGMSALDVCLVKMDMHSRGPEMLQMIMDHSPGAAARCDPSPLMILAWNNSSLSDEECRKVTRLLMEGGADPDGGTGPKPRTPREMPGRVRDFVQEWEIEKRARDDQARMDGDTPKVPGATLGSLRL